METRYKTSSGRHLILDLHAAALVATLTDASLAETGTGTVQADIRTAGLGQLLRHEQQFWYYSARAGGLPDGQEESAARALRQIIAGRLPARRLDRSASLRPGRARTWGNSGPQAC